MRRHCGWIAAASILATLAPAQAQQSGVSNSRLMFDPAGLQGPESRQTITQTSPTTGQSIAQPKPAVSRDIATPKPPAAPTARSVAAPNPPARATASAPPRPAAPRRPAQAENADNRPAAENTRTTERPIPREQPQALGRVTLPDGSLGFENKTQLNTYDMSDGRRVPGYDNIQRNDSSYFGLSLRMPTTRSSPPLGSSSSPFDRRDAHGAN